MQLRVKRAKSAGHQLKCTCPKCQVCVCVCFLLFENELYGVCVRFLELLSYDRVKWCVCASYGTRATELFAVRELQSYMVCVCFLLYKNY